jgi:hypothetical protein
VSEFLRRHFGPLFGKKIGGVEILSPAEALTRVLARPASRAR